MEPFWVSFLKLILTPILGHNLVVFGVRNVREVTQFSEPFTNLEQLGKPCIVLGRNLCPGPRGNVACTSCHPLAAPALAQDVSALLRFV